MAEENWQKWFEASWEFREERIYKALFGNTGPGIYTLESELFTSGFRQSSVDPRWLHDGIFECPPNDGRQSWLYVSSGLSNPWEQDPAHPREVSGLGCEFILECLQEAKWALSLLRRMIAFQRLLSVGRFPGKNILQVWDRIPLRASIDGNRSALTWVLLAPAEDLGESPQLPSGRFQFVRFHGITENEANYASKNGGDKLLQLLRSRTAAPVTDPNRSSILGDAELPA
jgi:hypothetical protein